MSVAVGLLVAVGAAVLPGSLAGRRTAVGARGRRVGGSGRARLPGSRGADGGVGALRGRAGGRGRAAPQDLVGLLHTVAARVRAGVPPGAAWAAVLGHAVAGDVPDADALVAAVGDRAATRARVRAVVAGAHVAAETGAPLADVLEHLADAVAADAEQAGELESALAGPRATARVLAALPVLGLLVGAGMGARPWDVLTDGGLGTVLAGTGVGLLVAGQVWVRALLRRAASP